MLETHEVQDAGRVMISAVQLAHSPVGVRFLSDSSPPPGDARRLSGYRFCQALMEARDGASVLLDGQGIACPAAAAAFGFRPLPDALKSGRGLAGFGIVSEEAVGARMFELMPRLKPGEIHSLHLFPLDRAPRAPDVIVVEATVEELMWIALACLLAEGGERVQASTAVLQATCVDATIIPFLEQRLNLSYGCYGCREATDLGPDEAVVGFPGSLLPGVVEHLNFLSKKAIPGSRGKRALSALRNGAEAVSEAKPSSVGGQARDARQTRDVD